MPEIFTPADYDNLVAAMVQLHCTERHKNGHLPPVKYSSILHVAARQHAMYLAETDVLSHTGKGGSGYEGRLRSAGYTFTPVGENVAMKGPISPDIEEHCRTIMHDWRNSTPHWKNILNAGFNEIGAACVMQRTWSLVAAYWCVNFGCRPVQDGRHVGEGTHALVGMMNVARRLGG